MNKIHIVIATDSNYLIHSRVLLKSIEANHHGEVVCHVFAFGLNEDEKRVLNDTATNVECIFYDVDEAQIQNRLFAGKTMERDRSLATYSRLLIPELLDKNIAKCFYLDVDAIVLSSMTEVFETDLTGFAIAGVLDTNPLRRHNAVGLSPEDAYINAGMILWNLDYCREKNVVDRFASFIQSRNGNVDAMDQGTINGTLSKEIKILRPNANVLTSFFQMSSMEIKKYYGVNTYTDSELVDACDKPVFVHFTPNLTTRPWVKHCKHPLAHLYWKYRELISPINMPCEDNRAFKMRVLSWLFYNCRSLYSLAIGVRR